MNKNELILNMATQSGLTQQQAKNALDAFCATVIAELAAGGEVNIVGFGSWSVVERAERNGINPQTKEPITIAASKAVKFKAGKSLKDAVA